MACDNLLSSLMSLFRSAARDYNGSSYSISRDYLPEFLKRSITEGKGRNDEDLNANSSSDIKKEIAQPNQQNAEQSED